MRRGLYVLMMVVLVLRGLTGIAMAAGVLPPMTPSLAPVQAPHAQHQAQEQAHHHDDEATSSAACDGSTAGCAAHEHHTAACSACEICHSAMLDAPAAPTPGRLSPGPQRPLTTAQFDSAPLALAIKPPIA